MLAELEQLNAQYASVGFSLLFSSSLAVDMVVCLQYSKASHPRKLLAAFRIIENNFNVLGPERNIVSCCVQVRLLHSSSNQHGTGKGVLYEAHRRFLQW